ncbi:hypothetical protein [Brachybacterium sp.]|uniref:hypothetical protein n=1 Tax=Brachybacterium sp. TaxID=1891286 RepID=UPI002ED538A5
MSTGAEVPRTISWSGAARRTERSGQRRSWRSGRRAASLRSAAARRTAALLGLTLLLAGCTTSGAAPEKSAPAEEPSAASEAPAEDPALAAACAEFWGDPDYRDPLSRTVLDRAGSAPEVGPSDPFFYAMTGDDIDAAFEQAPEPAQQAAAVLAEWFRTEPERGMDADRAAFAGAWEGLAAPCQELSVAAAWSLSAGEDGTKPAALVCADVFDTPGTLTHFANANVLTSNMFKLVGLSPREVPGGREDDVRATAELLGAEIAAVDDPAVAAALEQVRTPFLDALEGDTWSDGLSASLTELGTACEAAGYPSPAPGEIPQTTTSDQDSGPSTEVDDGIVGAGAQDGTHHGGRS